MHATNAEFGNSTVIVHLTGLNPLSQLAPAEDVYCTAFEWLEKLQPTVKDTPAGRARMLSVYQRMRILEAEMAGIGEHLSDDIHSYRLVLDMEAVSSEVGTDTSSQAWGSTASERIKALAPATVSGAVAMDNIATRTLRRLKQPGPTAAVTGLLAIVGWHQALKEERRALGDEKARAWGMLVAATTGVAATVFDGMTAGLDSAIKHGGTGWRYVGPVIRQLQGRCLTVIRAGGSAAGALTMFITFAVDADNVLQSNAKNEDGLVIMYAIRGVIELAGTGLLAANIYTIITSGEALALMGGPIIWIIAGAIIAVTVIIEIEKNKHAGIEWARNCLFGHEPQYQGTPRKEQEAFHQVLAKIQ